MVAEFDVRCEDTLPLSVSLHSLGETETRFRNVGSIGLAGRDSTPGKVFSFDLDLFGDMPCGAYRGCRHPTTQTDAFIYLAFTATGAQIKWYWEKCLLSNVSFSFSTATGAQFEGCVRIKFSSLSSSYLFNGHQGETDTLSHIIPLISDMEHHSTHSRARVHWTCEKLNNDDMETKMFDQFHSVLWLSSVGCKETQDEYNMYTMSISFPCPPAYGPSNKIHTQF